MTDEQKRAYDWAKNQIFPSVAARYAKVLADFIEELNRTGRPEAEAPQPVFEDGFDVSNADGSEVDYEALGRAHGLRYCDIDGFAIMDDGSLILIDDCGKTAQLDRGDFHIEDTRRAMAKGDGENERT